jgi:hypothetical protein
MNHIDQELISNKQILTFQNLGNTECKAILLSVTRGMASHEQKQYCYQQYIAESCDSDPALNMKYFNKNNLFELWCENELIGLCHNTAIIQDWIRCAKSNNERTDEKKKETLFLTCSLEAVFILKKYRGKKLGRYFSGAIRDVQLINLFGLLAHQKVKTIKHVRAVSFCDYETKGGESFHMELCSDFNGAYIRKIVNHLGYSYEGDISGSY